MTDASITQVIVTGMSDFWERAEQVQRFSDLEPDRHVVALLEHVDNPSGFPVLDIGCAGGRNAWWLAHRGFDIRALDASVAMVVETQRRIIPVLGEEDAHRRVTTGRMDDLSAFEDGDFQLVLAIGLLHNAQSRREWRRTLQGISRVLAPEGQLLVSSFAPETQLDGKPLRQSSADPDLFEGSEAGPPFLVDASELDREAKSLGLVPVRPTETIRKEIPNGCRVTVNGLYVKSLSLDS